MKKPALVALLLLAACGCPHDRKDLEQAGTGPEATELVLAAAQEACGRPLRGRIEWTSDPTGDEAGHCSWPADGCPMDAWVWDMRGTGVEHAFETSLAHEIGHWCLWSGDEDAVEAWASGVNDTAVTAWGDRLR